MYCTSFKWWEIWNQVWLYISHKKPTLHVDALLPGKNKIIAWGCLKAVYFFLILQQNIISSSSSCASGVRTKELKSTVSNFKSPILFHSWTLHPFLALFRVLWCQRFWHTDQQRSKTRGFKECVLENMQSWLAMHEASNAIKNYSVWFWKVHGRVHFLCRVLKAKVFKHVKKGKCNHWGILTRKIAGFLGMSNSPASIGSLCWPHAKILFFVMDFHTCDFVEHNFRCVMTYFDCNFIIIKLLSSNANKILEASVVHETKICATSKCLCNVWGCKMKPEAWRSWDSCLSNVFGLDFPLLKP